MWGSVWNRGTVWERLEALDTVWERLRAPETVWHRLEGLRASGTIWKRLGGLAASGVVWDWDRLGASGSVRDRLEPSGGRLRKPLVCGTCLS